MSMFVERGINASLALPPWFESQTLQYKKYHQFGGIFFMAEEVGCASLARTSFFGVNSCTLSPVRTPRYELCSRTIPVG